MMDYIYMVNYFSPDTADEFVVAFLSNEGAEAYIAEEMQLYPEFAERLYIEKGPLFP